MGTSSTAYQDRSDNYVKLDIFLMSYEIISTWESY